MSSGKTQSRMLYGELRVVLPEEWENRTVYTFTAPGTAQEMMPGVPLKESVTVMKMDISNELSADKIVSSLFVVDTSGQSKIKVQEPVRTCVIGGKNAWRRRITIDAGRANLEQTQCLIEVGRVAYLFTYVGKCPLSADQLSWFDQFLEALKFAS